MTADFVPTDSTNYNTLPGLSAGNFVIDKATPTATLVVNNSPKTYTGAGLGATVSVTTSSVPGAATNVLTGGALTQTNAGTYAVTADFVPTDSANYNTLTGLSAGNFVIDKATPTATLAVNNSPKTYTGAGLAAAVSVSTSSVPGAAANVLTGGVATQTNAGTYAVTADFVPTDSANYNTLTGLSAGNFVIDKANPVFTVSGNTCTYSGNPCIGSATAKGVMNEALTPVALAVLDVARPRQSATCGAGERRHLFRFGSIRGRRELQPGAGGDASHHRDQQGVERHGGHVCGWAKHHLHGHRTSGDSDGDGCWWSEPVGHAYDLYPGGANPPVDVGSYQAAASYPGDDNHEPSTGSASLTIIKASTTTQITGDLPDPSTLGSAYTVSWSVGVTALGGGTPTGTVTVTDGSAACSAAVAAGGCPLISTTTGAKLLKATFSGDGNFQGSSSATAPHNVQYTFTGSSRR